jgi:hypothetical protein
VAAVVALTEVYFTTLAGGALPLVRYVPALLLLSDFSLYSNRTPMAPALLVGLALAILFVRLSRRWSNGAALLAAFAAMLLAAYYLAGMAIVFFAPAAAMALRRASPRPAKRRLAAGLATALPLLALCSVAALSYHLSARDRSLAALDYHCSHEDWPAVIDASRRLETGDFSSLTRYEVNLALYEMNRLGDDMFRFPQAGSLLPELHTDRILPHMLRITDLCLRLGRVDDAERFGSEAMVLRQSDPRICRLMAGVNLVKGQTGVARKFLTALSYEVGSGAWARQRLRDLDRDPQLNGDVDVQLLRRRMLRQDDVLPVWQRAGKPAGDMERLLLDQLEQDPSNRMAFEFLMGSYLVARDMAAIVAAMPRIKDITGPAYIGPGGRRRTPRHFQEAMAMYAASTGQPVNIDGLEIQPETMARLAVFKRIMDQSLTREAARDAAWTSFRDSYFFYFVFGPGDYR